MSSWVFGDFRLRRWSPMFKNQETERRYLSDRFLVDHLSIARAFIVFSLFYSIFAAVDLQLTFIDPFYFHLSLAQKMIVPLVGVACFFYVNRNLSNRALDLAVFVYAVVFIVNLFLTFYGYTHWITEPVTLLEITMAGVFVNLLISIYAPLRIHHQLLSTLFVTLMTLVFIHYEIHLNGSKSAFCFAFLVIANGFAWSVTITIHRNFRRYWANKQERDFDNSRLRQEIRQRERLEVELKRQAMTDTLTNIDNRRSVLEHLSREVKRAQRQHNPLSVINFDIDLFKHINDEFGHDVGDRVLIDVARLVEERIRESDIFGRMGGEEFAILIPEGDIEDARKLAELLRQALHHLATPYKDKIIKVTASFGVAQFNINEDIDALLKRADQAMYKAKHAGRDCVKTQLQL